MVLSPGEEARVGTRQMMANNLLMGVWGRLCQNNIFFFKLVMAFSASAAVSARQCTACHEVAKRSNSEEQFIPGGPELPTPVCTRCPERRQVREVQVTEQQGNREVSASKVATV